MHKYGWPFNELFHFLIYESIAAQKNISEQI